MSAEVSDRVLERLRSAGLTLGDCAEMSNNELWALPGIGKAAIREIRKVHPLPDPPKTRPGRNGGMLLAGGKPGNKGGRRPSAVRQALLEDFAETAPLLKDFAEDEELSPRERIAAITELGKFGLGPAKAGYTQDELNALMVKLAHATRLAAGAHFDAPVKTMEAFLNDFIRRWKEIADEAQGE